MLVNIANEQAKAGAEVSIIIINDWLEKSLVDTLSSRVRLTEFHISVEPCSRPVIS